jgi:hypothetical protein
VDFSPVIIEELQRKVDLRRHDPLLANSQLATT